MSEPATADAIDDITVILLAAGAGERLGSTRPKAFVGVGNRILLAHSLERFDQHEAVDSIVIVVPEGWEEPTAALVDDLGCDRVTAIATGGATRAESVRNGLEYVAIRHQTALLVHDAARPFVASDVVDRVLYPMPDGVDAVVPVLPVADTIKEVDAEGRVVRTPPRKRLVAAQTPQCCRATSLAKALEALGDAELAQITDDAAAVEGAGGLVVTVAGDPDLRKITDPVDLDWARGRVGPSEALEAGGPDDDELDDAGPVSEDEIWGEENLAPDEIDGAQAHDAG